MRNDHELDDFIDAALPSYSDAEPRVGMEARILVRAFAIAPRRRRLPWLWIVSAPVLACAVGLIWMFSHRPSPKTMPSLQARVAIPSANAQPHTKKPEPGFAQVKHFVITQHHVSRVQPAHVTQLPKQDTFPSPAPLTPEEREIVALTHSWGPAMTADSSIANIDIAPLEIAALHIKPLGKSDSGTDDTANTTSSSKTQQP